MTMPTRKFTVARHEEFGTIGLVPQWYPNGDPLSGMAAAHDVLEHFPNDDGSTAGELMALGASLFTRGDGGYHNQYRHYDRVRDPASDIPMVWGYLLNRDGRGSLPACRPVRDHDALADGRAIITEAVPEMRHQFQRGDLPTVAERETMARWIARGYVRARRRYRGVVGGACALATVFMEIEREADRLLKHAEEGMELTVIVNVKRASVRVFCDYPTE
jgi:hypothetical protein